MKILVTGGAGYIGSHVVKQLLESKNEVLIYDNLSTGFKKLILSPFFVKGDLLNKNLLEKTINDFQPEAVMHFAAFSQVGDSIENPMKYYENNVSGTINLLKLVQKHNVKKFIFSSTAAVYGVPKTIPISEKEKIKPINPYGKSKSILEVILKDLSTSSSLKYISLRYFNAAGADPEGKIGEMHNPESHLIPIVLKTALKKRESVSIFGTDYPTPDKTCIRDYIHVVDLANAHLKALDYLLANGKSDCFNVGYGNGFSVKEIINSVKKITKNNFNVIEQGRRDGDPHTLIADNKKIRTKLNWSPKYNDLDYIIKTAYQWEKTN